MTPPRRLLALAALFLLHALPFLTRPALIGGDEPHYALMAWSMGVDGNLDLEPDYLAVEEGSRAAGRKFAGRRLDRHLVAYPRGLPESPRYFSHPLGLPALVSGPIALLHRLSADAAPDLLLGVLGLVVSFLALLAGARLLSALGLDRPDARLLAFSLYFATPLWYYSRIFSTEAWSWSLAILSIYLLWRRRWITASLLLGAVFLLKESGALVILPILLLVWKRFGLRRASLFALGPLGALALWCMKNLAIYGHPVVTFQPFRIGDPLAGAVGLLLDPRHGLLPFAPVLALALLAAFARTLPRRRWLDLELTGLAAFSATFVMAASWTMWWGGSCYGPRLLVPVIPGLAVSLALAWRRLESRPPGRSLFLFLTAVGFGVQFVAAIDPFAAFWERSVVELAARRPLALACGVALGLVGAAFCGRRTRGDRLTIP